MNIAFGKENIEGESMHAILFCNTPKYGLQNYVYMLRNMEPFGTDLNNLVCSRLGTMLYLGMQNRKEAMQVGSSTGGLRDDGSHEDNNEGYKGV